MTAFLFEADDNTARAYHPFRPQLVGFGDIFRIDHQLCEAVPVAKVDEDESAMVATPGNSGRREAAAVASALIRPERTCSSVEERLMNASWVSPEISEGTIWPAPPL